MFNKVLKVVPVITLAFLAFCNTDISIANAETQEHPSYSKEEIATSIEKADSQGWLFREIVCYSLADAKVAYEMLTVQYHHSVVNVNGFTINNVDQLDILKKQQEFRIVYAN